MRRFSKKQLLVRLFATFFMATGCLSSINTACAKGVILGDYVAFHLKDGVEEDKNTGSWDATAEKDFIAKEKVASGKYNSDINCEVSLYDRPLNLSDCSLYAAYANLNNSVSDTYNFSNNIFTIKGISPENLNTSEPFLNIQTVSVMGESGLSSIKEIKVENNILNINNGIKFQSQFSSRIGNSIILEEAVEGIKAKINNNVCNLTELETNYLIPSNIVSIIKASDSIAEASNNRLTISNSKIDVIDRTVTKASFNQVDDRENGIANTVAKASNNFVDIKGEKTTLNDSILTVAEARGVADINPYESNKNSSITDENKVVLASEVNLNGHVTLMAGVAEGHGDTFSSSFNKVELGDANKIMDLSNANLEIVCATVNSRDDSEVDKNEILLNNNEIRISNANFGEKEFRLVGGCCEVYDNQFKIEAKDNIISLDNCIADEIIDEYRVIAGVNFEDADLNNKDLTCSGNIISLNNSILYNTKVYGYTADSEIQNFKNNSVVVSGKNLVASIENTNCLEFKLVSDESNNVPMLEVTGYYEDEEEKVENLDLTDLTINALIDGNTGEFESIVLVKNISGYDNGTYKINNSDSSKVISSSGNVIRINSYEMAEENDGTTKSLAIKKNDSVAYFAGSYGPSEEDFNIDTDVKGELGDLTEIYGIVADKGSATNASIVAVSGLNLENVSIIGGKVLDENAVTPDETTGNTLSLEGKGAKFKEAIKIQNYEFTLTSDTKAGDKLLVTTNAVDLGNADSITKKVNVSLNDFVLEKDQKLILMSNVNNKTQAELMLAGEVRDKLYSYKDMTTEKNFNYLKVNSLSYDSSCGPNEIGLVGGESFKTAVFNTNALTARTMILNEEDNSTLSNEESIYGAYSTIASSKPEGSTIELQNNNKLTKARLIGGFDSVNNNAIATSNDLKVTGINNQVLSISNFENLNFVLPTEIKSGDTMLSVKDNVDLTPTKSIRVSATADAVASLKNSAGSSQFVNLLTTEGTIQNYDETTVDLSSFTDIKAKVEKTVDAKTLKFSLVGDETANNQTKAPVEGISAATALVDSSNDLAAGDLGRNLATLGQDGLNTFAAMTGGKTRYHSGSHIDSNAWNIGVGIGKKGLSKKNPNSTYGLFFNYGKSKFDTFNDGFVGNGKSRASGMGLMFHSVGKNNYYYDGSVFIGKVKTDWNSSLGGYNTNSTFRGFNFTMGHKYELKSNKLVDTYAKYMFSHTNASSATIGAYEYSFDAVESSRLRFGFRVECSKDEKAGRPFYGLAYEREFNGEAKASMNLGKVDSPSLKGDTGILEVGYKWSRGAWDFNFTCEGTIGKREGVTGSFNAFYNF